MPKTWLPDPSHYPEQLTPLSATVWFEAIGQGIHEAMRELQGPFGGFEARTEGWWAYEGELEPEWDHDPGRMRSAALGVAERWERELVPRSHALTDALHRLRPEEPSPEEAAALLDRMWELVRDQWIVHFLAVFPAQFAVEMLHQAHVEVFGHEDPLAAYRLLDAVRNETNEADEWLWNLARRAGELGVDPILREHRPGPALERLGELRDGRRWLADLDRYLLSFGGRSRWHELSLPREAEVPAMTLDSVRLFLERGEPPRTAPVEEAARLEKEALAAAPGLAEILPAARAGYAIKETHVYHIDYPGLLATREVLLGFGRRLLAEGRIGALSDVWMLRRGEVREALLDGDPRELALLVERRRNELAEGLREGYRPFLGQPPSDETRDVVLENFYGRAGGEAGAGRFVGTGASPGVGEGRSVVAGDQDSTRRIQAGDILVTTTTTPAWTPLFPSLAGLVTETGGILSHAAIVAREYGLPCVVGVQGATTSIPEGVQVRVDGSTGEVIIVGRTER
jgi:rifampicin phosphotransferase